MPDESNTQIQHKIVTFKYHLVSTVFFVGLGSFLTTLGCSAIIMLLNALGIQTGYHLLGILWAVFLIGGACLIAHVATRRLPEIYWQRYLPAWLPLIVTLASWSIGYLLAEGSSEAMFKWFGTPFVILHFTYVIPILFIIMMEKIWLIFAMPFIFNLTFVIMFIIFERQKSSRPPAIDKKFILYIMVIILVCLFMTVIGFIMQ